MSYLTSLLSRMQRLKYTEICLGFCLNWKVAVEVDWKVGKERGEDTRQRIGWTQTRAAALWPCHTACGQMLTHKPEIRKNITNAPPATAALQLALPNMQSTHRLYVKDGLKLWVWKIIPVFLKPPKSPKTVKNKTKQQTHKQKQWIELIFRVWLLMDF